MISVRAAESITAFNKLFWDYDMNSRLALSCKLPDLNGKTRAEVRALIGEPDSLRIAKDVETEAVRDIALYALGPYAIGSVRGKPANDPIFAIQIRYESDRVASCTKTIGYPMSGVLMPPGEVLDDDGRSPLISINGFYMRKFSSSRWKSNQAARLSMWSPPYMVGKSLAEVHEILGQPEQLQILNSGISQEQQGTNVELYPLESTADPKEPLFAIEIVYKDGRVTEVTKAICMDHKPKKD